MTWLHAIGRFTRDALLAVPLEWVRGGVLLALAGLLVWVLLLPRETVVNVDPQGRRTDLRWGAAAALLVQLALYAWF